MAALDARRRSAAARKAALLRAKSPNLKLVAEADRDLSAARLEDYITQAVAQAPPLTPEQRQRLSLLLNGGGAA